MRTKQFFYFCSIVALVMTTSLTASAQYMVEEQIVVAEPVPGKVYYYEDRNIDNWYLSLGAGTQFYLAEQAGSDVHFTLAMNLAVGKWINPYWGMRMSAMAGTLHFDWDNNYGSMRYGAFYLDFLWNMTNSLIGYNENRFFSFIPFLGLGGSLGWHHTGSDVKTWALPVTGGLKINMRLSRHVDFFLEGRVQAVADPFNNVRRGGQVEMITSAVGGFTFKFGGGFKSYNPYMDRVAIDELNRRTNQLRQQLNDCQSRKVECPPCPEVTPTVSETVIVEQQPCSNMTATSVMFTINSAVVTEKEMANIYNVAQWLKDNNECNVTVTGYADRNTGSSDYNMQLSRRRAQAVADILMNKYGVSSSRINIESEGSNQQPYPDNNDWNRVVIFTGTER